MVGQSRSVNFSDLDNLKLTRQEKQEKRIETFTGGGSQRMERKLFFQGPQIPF